MCSQFDSEGRLPPGIHEWDWQEFEHAFGWTEKRRELLEGMGRALRELKAAGGSRVYINGSFVTNVDEPKDFDGCWEAQGVDLQKLDPVLLNFEPGRLSQKKKYDGELFLAHRIAERATGKRFLEFFQQDREGNDKGIVALNLETLP